MQGLTSLRDPLGAVSERLLVARALPADPGRLFVKLYLSLRTSGLLAALGDRDLRTLVALVTFMDEESVCYPSQACLARTLGISQPAAGKRVKALLRFRPLLDALIRRRPDGRYENTIYRIGPEAPFAIFDGPSPL